MYLSLLHIPEGYQTDLVIVKDAASMTAGYNEGMKFTSRSIESGIPQRAWDILAVGGFCLTNYQPELEEYFEIGKDLEVWHDLPELEEKMRYYLAHEEQRIRIAINGYQKVRKYHSLQTRLEGMLQNIFDEDNQQFSTTGGKLQ